MKACPFGCPDPPRVIDRIATKKDDDGSLVYRFNVQCANERTPHVVLAFGSTAEEAMAAWNSGSAPVRAVEREMHAVVNTLVAEGQSLRVRLEAAERALAAAREPAGRRGSWPESCRDLGCARYHFKGIECRCVYKPTVPARQPKEAATRNEFLDYYLGPPSIQEAGPAEAGGCTKPSPSDSCATCDAPSPDVEAPAVPARRDATDPDVSDAVKVIDSAYQFARQRTARDVAREREGERIDSDIMDMRLSSPAPSVPEAPACGTCGHEPMRKEVADGLPIPCHRCLEDPTDCRCVAPPAAPEPAECALPPVGALPRCEYGPPRFPRCELGRHSAAAPEPAAGGVTEEDLALAYHLRTVDTGTALAQALARVRSEAEAIGFKRGAEAMRVHAIDAVAALAGEDEGMAQRADDRQEFQIGIALRARRDRLLLALDAISAIRVEDIPHG